MKMEHYLSHTNYPIWQVIQNGNGPVSVTTDANGMIKVLPPKTAEEVVAREKERKARTTLLMALPEDHLAKFHKMADAKEMWEAIKSRFGSNDESKNMQKYLLKQQLEGFSVSTSEGLHKGFDRFQTLLSQFEIIGAGVSHEDANQKFLRHFARDCRAKGNRDSRRKDVGYNRNKTKDNGRRPAYQDDSKALVTIDGEDIDWSGHVEEDAQNYAMMTYSSSNSGSDNEVKSYTKACEESYARLKKLYDEQRDKLGDASVEITAYTLALKKVEAQLLCHQQNQLTYEQNIRFMKIDLDDKTDVLAHLKKLLAEALNEKEDLKTKFENWQNSSKNLGRLLNTQMSANDKFGLGYGDYRFGSILSYKNEVLQSVFMNKASDLEDTPVNDRYANRMHATSADKSDSKPSEYASCKSDSSVETSTSMSEPVENASKVVCEPKVWTDAPIIKEYESDSDNDSVSNVQEDKEKPRKFYGKSDSGFLVGYSLNSKACRVYNLETKRVEENLQVNFLENKPNVSGKGHAWMFDLDYLTNYMNYELVSLENQANKSACPKEANNSAYTQANGDQCANSEEIDLNEEHFVLPIWSVYSTNVKSSGDKIEKNTDFKTCEKLVSQVWILVDLPFRKKAIWTKWVYRNKKDEMGVVVRNKARLVAQGHRQEEGIDYDEV
nr:ribonuclease H-like domain-containing protein [Tanacetum cinerariifolium]